MLAKGRRRGRRRGKSFLPNARNISKVLLLLLLLNVILHCLWREKTFLSLSSRAREIGRRPVVAGEEGQPQSSAP